MEKTQSRSITAENAERTEKCALIFLLSCLPRFPRFVSSFGLVKEVGNSLIRRTLEIQEEPERSDQVHCFLLKKRNVKEM
jgi:hypothetical protein